MNELIIAFGLSYSLIFYMPYFQQKVSMLNKIEFISDSQLRTGGLIFMILGFIIIFFKIN